MDCRILPLRPAIQPFTVEARRRPQLAAATPTARPWNAGSCWCCPCTRLLGRMRPTASWCRILPDPAGALPPSPRQPTRGLPEAAAALDPTSPGQTDQRLPDLAGAAHVLGAEAHAAHCILLLPQPPPLRQQRLQVDVVRAEGWQPLPARWHEKHQKP